MQLKKPSCTACNLNNRGEHQPMGRGRKNKSIKMIRKDNQRAKKARTKKKADAVKVSRKHR